MIGVTRIWETLLILPNIEARIRHRGNRRESLSEAADALAPTMNFEASFTCARRLRTHSATVFVGRRIDRDAGVDFGCCPAGAWANFLHFWGMTGAGARHKSRRTGS
jgi:hypothetical protein